MVEKPHKEGAIYERDRMKLLVWAFEEMAGRFTGCWYL